MFLKIATTPVPKKTPTSLRKTTFLKKMYHFHCTIVLFRLSRAMVPGRAQASSPGPRPRPTVLDPWPLALGPGSGPTALGRAHGREGPEYILKLPIHRHRAALLVRYKSRLVSCKSCPTQPCAHDIVHVMVCM